MVEPKRPEMAKTWRAEMGVGLIVNDTPFPWHVAADPGLMVESIGIDEHVHVLWVPLLIEAPLPGYGTPDGAQVPTPTEPTR